jgi:hypothetical protein
MHIAEMNGKPEWMYLLEGGSITKGKINLSASNSDFSHRGKISDIKRMEKGDKCDGFVTNQDLPADGSLNGRTLLLTLGDGRTEGYTIKKTERAGSETLIHVNEEPGIEIRDNGRLAKLVYFPWHGVRGDVNFLISGSVYRDRDGKIETTAKLK